MRLIETVRQWFVFSILAVVFAIIGIIYWQVVQPPSAEVNPSQLTGDSAEQPFGVVPQEGDGVPGGADAATPTTPPPTPSQRRIHVVASGESLFTIAQQYDTTIEAIVAANSLDDPDRLDIGDELIIPSATP